MSPQGFPQRTGEVRTKAAFAPRRLAQSGKGALGSLRSGPQRAAGAGCEVTWVTWRPEQSGEGDITYPPFRIRFPDT